MTAYHDFLLSVCPKWWPGEFDGRRVLTCTHGFAVQNQDFPVDKKGRATIQQVVVKGHEWVLKQPDAEPNQ